VFVRSSNAHCPRRAARPLAVTEIASPGTWQPAEKKKKVRGPLSDSGGELQQALAQLERVARRKKREKERIT
jgi:hypothetical protein